MFQSDKIKSIREQMGVGYVRPNPTRVLELQKNLADSKEAMEYLTLERGFVLDTINHFKLGYDKDKNAISIPHYKGNELINIKYRFIKPDKIKYVGERGAESWIFNEAGLQEGIKKGGVLTVEGEMDCISTWQAGIKNVISPASGKDSYGVWIEQLDNLPKVYIAYDNDKPGQTASFRFAERIGLDKTFEVKYPEGIKDANDFFKKYTIDDFRELLKNAQPFYKHKYKGVGDVLVGLRNAVKNLELKLMPKVKLGKDWMVVISGISNVGKTGYVLNLADELTTKELPVLVLPFERGIDTVGKRFVQVKFNKAEEDFGVMSNDEWVEVVDRCVDLPLYFAMPGRENTLETIKEAKRLFDIKVVIIDHLDYMMRHVSQNKESEIGNTLQDLKRLAEENEILMLVVTHIRKIQMPGSSLQRKPSIEDLKGASALYQDPEVVILLSQEDGNLLVDIAKNKGEMIEKTYGMNKQTGRVFELKDSFEF